MIGKRHAAATLCVLLMWSLHPSFSAGAPANSEEAGGRKKPWTAFKISKETTILTEPLREDGYVNYVAVLNEMTSEGVTPENNAAIPFWKAVGPRPIKWDNREEFFNLLGIERLPEDGKYFVDFWWHLHNTVDVEDDESGDVSDDVIDAHLDDFHNEAARRPWKGKEFPKIAEWIQANKKPLDILVAASRRTRFFSPICPENGPSPSVPILIIPELRDTARALSARAMLRLGEGNVDEAWTDLLACHRIARLSGQGAILVDVMVEAAIEGMALRCHETLLQDGSLTAARIAQMRTDLKNLPPTRSLVERIKTAERYIFISMVAEINRSGVSLMDRMSFKALLKGKSTYDKAADWVLAAAIDWEAVLRLGHAWYDRTEEALEKPTRAERHAALRRIEQDLKKMEPPANATQLLSITFLGNSREAASERFAERFVEVFMPAIIQSDRREDRGKMHFRITELAFALAEYRADNGSYPAKLADLRPKYVDNIPDDIFRDKPLTYEQKGNGYLLYSIGPNGVDENGRGEQDRGEEDKWDDISVEVK